MKGKDEGKVDTSILTTKRIYKFLCNARTVIKYSQKCTCYQDKDLQFLIMTRTPNTQVGQM